MQSDNQSMQLVEGREADAWVPWALGPLIVVMVVPTIPDDWPCGYLPVHTLKLDEEQLVFGGLRR